LQQNSLLSLIVHGMEKGINTGQIISQNIDERIFLSSDFIHIKEAPT
jgi:hypothetical protein